MANMKTLTVNGVTYTIDDPDAVSYGTQQALTKAQKQQARDNIGAASQAQLDNLAGQFDIVHSPNLLDLDAVTAGKYVHTDGRLLSNANYTTTDFIPCQPGDTIRHQFTYQGVRRYDNTERPNYTQMTYICAYDAEHNYVAGSFASGKQVYTVPDGAYYVRISYTGWNTGNYSKHAILISDDATVLPFTEYGGYAACSLKPDVLPGNVKELMAEELPNRVAALEAEDLPNRVAALESVPVDNMVLTASAAALNDGEYLELADNMDVKKNVTQTFFAKITDFTSLQVGHGETKFMSNYVVIDETNVSVYYYSTSAVLRKQEAHGLTISDFISVSIIGKTQKADIVVSTSTGRFVISNVDWYGCNGVIHAKSIGSTLTDCKLSWTCSDLTEDVWVFGDSYLGLTETNRFASYLIGYGFDKWLACAYSGAVASGGYLAFSNLVEMKTPKYAVWCLGMNNPDSGAINSSYLTNTQNFLAKCQEKGITPILCTIPSAWGSVSEDSDITVTRDNSYKNAWVKASGYRYIDFADAVEKADGTGWYDNMLSTDGVHPDVLGAITLADRFIRDFPEITMQR